MFPHADTYFAAVEAERAAKLQRAERRAVLLDATRRPQPARRPAVGVVATRLEWLERAVRSVRVVRRPAHG